jgi:hypothetical protein
MAQAYFATDKVAILSDYPCYFYLRRDDGGNAGKGTWEPADYYGYVREVLDVVAANTDAGEWRDAIHERFLNAMLQKVRAAATLRDGDKRLRAMMTEVSAVTGAYFSPQVAARPPILRRQLTAAILAGKPKKVQAAAGRYRRPVGAIQSFAVKPAEHGGWTISARASLRFRDGKRVRFRPAGDRWRVDPRLQVKNLQVRAEDADDLRTRTSADVVLRSATTGVEWLSARSLAASFEPVRAGGKAYHLQVAGTIELDPATFAAGAPLSADTWEVYLRLTGLGLSRNIAVQRSDFTELPSWKVRRRHPDARLRISRRDDLAVIVSR